MNTPLPEIELAIVHTLRTLEHLRTFGHSPELTARLELLLRGLIDTRAWIAEERDHGRRLTQRLKAVME